ncbi:MAG: universal stress protein [Bacteroidota bacterium]
MKRILVPVDFSETSIYAAKFAAEFSQLVQGELTLLHILEAPSIGFKPLGKKDQGDLASLYHQAFIEGVNNRLEELKEELEHKGAEIKILLKQGHAFDFMKKTMEEVETDLVIMGSKGASGLKEIFIGSNASRMVRYAECPVIVIKEETHLSEFTSIVFATDASIEQDQLSANVKTVQKLLKLDLHVLKVTTPYSWLEPSQVDAQLQRFVDRNRMEEFATHQISADYVDDGAIKFAELNNSGMIIIGTHARKGLGHLIGGSISESIVNESKIPIMVMKLS